MEGKRERWALGVSVDVDVGLRVGRIGGDREVGGGRWGGGEAEKVGQRKG